MADGTVRTLARDEHIAASRIVSREMLGSLADDAMAAWAERFVEERTHGAFSPRGELVGVSRWFPTELAMPGGAADAAAVTAVAVQSNHRRQGHLRRLMEAQLRAVAEEGRALAVLIAAEWPIYGRYGYGPATEACRWELDARSARFRDAPEGAIELVPPDRLRAEAEAVFRARWARTPGAITRDADWWDRAAGLAVWPGRKTDLSMVRTALWRDPGGEVAGAVVYEVAEQWTRNRPDGRADVSLLVGRTPVAERELWRHLCDIDWISTVAAGGRGIDDPLPLWLHDARSATQLDRSDHVWARVLDVPGAIGARGSDTAGRCVVEVVDPLGFTSGGWAIELGPDGGRATASEEEPDVTLPASALGAAVLGGTSLVRLHEAGWCDEGRAGGVKRVDALLRTAVAPWCPTDF